jgi:ATP-binding cassette, subfamily B, bacterial
MVRAATEGDTGSDGTGHEGTADGGASALLADGSTAPAVRGGGSANDGLAGDSLAGDAADARQGWRLIRRMSRERVSGLAVSVVCGLIWTAAKVSTGLIVRNAVDDGILADDTSALRRWAIALGVVAIVSATFTGLRRYTAFREARWVEARLRDRLFAHLQRLHFAFHDQTQTGQLMSRANTDLQQVQFFVVMIPLTISNTFTVLAVTVILLTIDPVLTLLALGSLPFMNVFATRFSRRLFPHMMGIQRESAELAAVVEESVAGVRVIKGVGAEAVQADRLAAEADDVYDESMAAARVRARFLPVLELLPNLGFIAVLGFGGHQVLGGHLTIGELLMFNVYIGMLIWPLRMLGMIVALAQRAAVSAQRVDEVLATAPAVDDPAHPVPLPGPQVDGVGPDARTAANSGATGTAGTAANSGATGTAGNGEARAGTALGEVVFDRVRFGYRAGTAPVLDGLDLRIAPGESVALVGATGSGKSTVARLIPRFYDVDAGAVRLDGVDVRDVRLRELRRAIGIVFEDTFLFSDTIAANIAFADPDASPADIERAARLAGAHDFVVDLAEGYGTRIGERGYSLSGGQRQRIAIARAILADPRVLILDDATSAVDPTKEHEIRDALTEVMRGRTTIVIAHRPATIALADRVVLLDRGRVAAAGTHAQLLATDARYRAVLAAAEVGHRDANGDEAGAADDANGAGRPITTGERR